jgi:hypothetical protein
MPTRFGRECGDEEGDDLSAEDRDQDDQRAPGAGRREHVCLVVERKDAEERKVVDKPNEVAEHHRAKAGHQPNDNRQEGKPNQP